MNEFQKVYTKALKFLSYRPRSEKEIRENLIQRFRKEEASQRQEIIEQVITKLKEQSFVNDEEFTRMWIESRVRSKPRALWVLKMELRQKGISNALIESLVHNSQSIIQDDLEMAKRLVEKKLPRLKNLPEEALRNKLMQLLARKGFGWDTIRDVIDEVVKKGV